MYFYCMKAFLFGVISVCDTTVISYVLDINSVISRVTARKRRKRTVKTMSTFNP